MYFDEYDPSYSSDYMLLGADGYPCSSMMYSRPSGVLGSGSIGGRLPATDRHTSG